MSEVKSNGKRKQRFNKVVKKSTDSSTEKRIAPLSAANTSEKKTSLQATAPQYKVNRVSIGADSDPLADSYRSGIQAKNWNASNKKGNLLKSVRMSPKTGRKESQISTTYAKRPPTDIEFELDVLLR